jgi:NADPH-dependent curcumin reductase CurA
MTDPTAGQPIGPNRQLRLVERPTGLVTEADFELVEVPAPELAEGEALMRTIYLGMDATVRTWLNRGEGYLPAVEIGEVVRCSGIGRIVATNSPAFEIGDVAYSLPGWQDYAIVRDDAFTTKIEDVSDLRSMMSVFGATGAAAYRSPARSPRSWAVG